MNILLWVVQALAALMFGASGVMKVFMFEKISADVPSFGALPRPAWTALGILELVCVVGLIAPAALHWQPELTAVAASVLAIESIVFVWVHVRYRELPPILMSGVLGLLTAFGELIPVVGPLLSAVPAILVALTVSNQAAVFTAVFFFLQQQVESHVLVPKVMGRQVGVSAVGVLVALLIGGSLLGVVGAILSIPTAAIIQVVVDELLDQRDLVEADNDLITG